MVAVHSGIRRMAAAASYFVLVFLIGLGLTAHAQLAGTASIQGTVTDSTGALLPNAAVTLINEATQVKHAATTDSAGAYTFPNIEVGTYSLTVGAQGFETYSKTNIVLEVGSSISQNVGMKVGATETRIEVQSEGLALQTEDPSFKQTIDQTQITEMPLNGRQMTALITLSGGSAPAPGGDFTGSKYSYAAISVSIAGGNGNTTQWRLDGGDNNDYMANANLPFPFPDAVNQFTVESTALGARAGSHSGGLVNVVTRSGTNTYHGSVFDFMRNNYINATNFFSVTKDSLHQNQVGGTFGGKILRDKLFAFAGYQYSRQKQGQASTQAHVPTAANLAGDFSATDPTQKLVNPITGVALVNNHIDPSLFNPQALALVKYLPQATDSSGFVSYTIPLWVFDKQFITRVDYTINPKNNMYGRYMLDGYQAPGFFDPHNILVTTQAGNVERVQSGVIGEDFSFSSKTVNTFHVSFARRVDVRGPAPGITACTLGVALNCPLPLSTGFQLTVGSTSTHGFNTYCGTCAPGHFNDNTLSMSDDVTLVRGKHEMVAGVESGSEPTEYRRRLSGQRQLHFQRPVQCERTWRRLHNRRCEPGFPDGSDVRLFAEQDAAERVARLDTECVFPGHLPSQYQVHCRCRTSLAAGVYPGRLLQPGFDLRLQRIPRQQGEHCLSDSSRRLVFLWRSWSVAPVHKEFALAVLSQPGYLRRSHRLRQDCISCGRWRGV